MNIIDTSAFGKPGRYLLPDGSVLNPPEDINLVSRILEELEARRIYGQPCERIKLGTEAWQWVLYHSVAGSPTLYRRLLEQSPDTMMACGLLAEHDATLPPTCFKVF